MQGFTLVIIGLEFILSEETGLGRLQKVVSAASAAMYFLVGCQEPHTCQRWALLPGRLPRL